MIPPALTCCSKTSAVIMSSRMVNSAMPCQTGNSGKRRGTREPEPRLPLACALINLQSALSLVSALPLAIGTSWSQMMPDVKKPLYIAPRRLGTFMPSLNAALSRFSLNAIAGMQTWPSRLTVQCSRQVRLSQSSWLSRSKNGVSCIADDEYGEPGMFSRWTLTCRNCFLPSCDGYDALRSGARWCEARRRGAVRCAARRWGAWRRDAWRCGATEKGQSNPLRCVVMRGGVQRCVAPYRGTLRGVAVRCDAKRGDAPCCVAWCRGAVRGVARRGVATRWKWTIEIVALRGVALRGVAMRSGARRCTERRCEAERSAAL